jgi:hypothetical protein
MCIIVILILSLINSLSTILKYLVNTFSMNILRSWLFKLSAVGGVSFGGLEYMIHKRDRP